MTALRTRQWAIVAALALASGDANWSSAAQVGTSFRYTARLDAPVPAPRVIQTGNLAWSCSGSACFARSTAAIPTVAQCRALAGAVGRITAFGSQARQLGPADITQCSAGIVVVRPLTLPGSKKAPGQLQFAPSLLGEIGRLSKGDMGKTGGETFDDVAPGEPPGGLVIQVPPVSRPPVTVTKRGTPSPALSPKTYAVGTLRMTGLRGAPATYEVGTLRMTGLRGAPATYEVGTLEMTGLRTAPGTYDVGTLEMTGLRTAPGTYAVGMLEMTGLRTIPGAYEVGALEMTGLRTAPGTYAVGTLEMTGLRTTPGTYEVGALEMTGLGAASTTYEVGTLEMTGLRAP